VYIISHGQELSGFELGEPSDVYVLNPKFSLDRGWEVNTIFIFLFLKTIVVTKFKQIHLVQ
jgi:hypothetical protein